MSETVTARERCDVLIVGGGPAGSSCAYGLRNAGFDVLVVDRARFPRDKVCAGWVTPPVFEALGIDRLHYARENVCQDIHGFSVALRGHRGSVVDYGRTVSHAIRRCEFDAYLLGRCEARVEQGRDVRTIVRTPAGWLVDDAIEARILVGAGGHRCPVARVLGAEKAETVVVAREFEVELTAAQRRDCGTRVDIPDLVFCPGLDGYGWVVRKGAFVNVGLGRIAATGLRSDADAFVREMVAAGRIPSGLEIRFKGHAYLTRALAERPLVDGDVILVGDAAGLAGAISGEGIRAAVESGLLAAAAIERRLREGRDLGHYADSVLRRFGSRGRPSRAASDLVPARWRGPLARYALTTRWFSRHVVVDRWFLARHVPTISVHA